MKKEEKFRHHSNSIYQTCCQQIIFTVALKEHFMQIGSKFGQHFLIPEIH